MKAAKLFVFAIIFGLTPSLALAQYAGGPIGLFGAVTVNPGPVSAGQVLGASTDSNGNTITCVARFSEFAMVGRNTASVSTIKNLQSFLNEYQNAKLSITGVYDQSTIEAVSRFQEANSSDVLTPWKLSTPTGNFYLTTRRKANIEYCRLRGINLNIPMLSPSDLVPWMN